MSMDLTALSKISDDPIFTSKIADYQSKIKVLLHNYKLIGANDKTMVVPEDQAKVYKMKIERELIKISKKQTRLIEKWKRKKKVSEKKIENVKEMEDIDPNTPGTSPATSPEASQENPQENSQEKSEISSTVEEVLKEVQMNPGQKMDLSNLTMKERMAIVRGMRKKGKKKGGPTAAAKAAAAKRAEKEAANASEITEEMIEAAKLELQPGQFNGDVNLEEMAEVARGNIHPESSIIRPNPTDKIVDLQEITFEQSEERQFMLNIGLLTPKDVETVSDHHEMLRRQKMHFRNMTYIPEMSDKKHRIKYTYLTPEAGSPPALRGRQCQTREASNGVKTGRLLT